MPDIQFEVTTDLAPISNSQIETNFEAVRDWLTETLAPYASMVVTPDAIGDAKKTRASIRKVGDSIDSQRKAVKKVWMKPFEDYEAKCKQLTGIVNEAVGNIDGQIKEMENEVKEQKRQRLSEYFDSISYGVADIITFDDIFDAKWLNATVAEETAQTAIFTKVNAIETELGAIRDMQSPYEAAMISEYGKTLSLPKAIAEGKRLEAIQRAEEERKAREAEDTFEGEEEPPAAPVPPVAPVQQFVRPVAVDEPPRPKMYTLRFEVEMTRDQMFALKSFFVNNGIRYTKI